MRCPRCGQEGYISVESRGRWGKKYVYMEHTVTINGRRITKKCYLGPLDSYEYVARFQSMPLYGLAREGREEEYLMALLAAIEERLGDDETPAHEKLRLRGALVRALARIRNILEKGGRTGGEEA